jgi:hypothetical protein
MRYGWMELRPFWVGGNEGLIRPMPQLSPDEANGGIENTE